MSAHTPAPWLIVEEKPLGSLKKRRFVGADGQGFAYTVGLTDEKDEANARLIAAAPTMLAALRIAQELLERNGIQRPEIEAAIAKASGKGQAA